MRDGEDWGQTGDDGDRKSAEVAGKQSWVGCARWEEMTRAVRLGELSVSVTGRPQGMECRTSGNLKGWCTETVGRLCCYLLLPPFLPKAEHHPVEGSREHQCLSKQKAPTKASVLTQNLLECTSSHSGPLR